MKKGLLIIALTLATILTNGQTAPFTTETYKTVDTAKLAMRIYTPQNGEAAKNGTPAIVLFFGGGWNAGTIDQLAPQAKYLANRGMIAILVQYRTKGSHKVTPFECVADAKSAMRYVRENAKRLGINPKKIAAGGGSAGGHLAAATAFVGEFDSPTDNLKISPVPNALVLFNPVIDNSPSGYGFDRVGDKWDKFSPMHNIKKNIPPTIFMVGSKDELLPVSTCEKFKRLIEEAGGRCDLFVYEGQKHAFYNYSPTKPDNFNKTMAETDKFLTSLGFLPKAE